MGNQNMSRGKDHDKGRRTAFVLALPVLALLLFVASLTPCPLLAQADTTKAPPPSSRCLLVVETSRSMQRRSDATLQIVQDMLKSGFAGQLRRGDTLGVWTYNESLYAGRFPLQTWLPEAQQDIALRTVAFLKAQKYEKQASFDKVLLALNQIIKDSPLITVILISSADEKIRGTPFDDRINEFYQKWHDEQQKARMPFVTVLRAQGGQFEDFTANTPPFPVQMPRLPQERQQAETTQSRLLEAVRTARPPTGQPLILSGKRAQPQKAPAPQPTPAKVKVEAPATAPGATSTNKSLAAKPPVAAPPAAQIAKAEVAPVIPDKPPVDLSSKASPAPMPVSETKPEIVKGPETKPITPAPAAAPVASALPSPNREPTPAALEPTTPAPAPEPKPAPPLVPASEPKAEVARGPETRPVALAPSKAEAATAIPTPAPKPVPAPPATREVSPSVTAAQPALVSSSTVPAPPVQAATAVPAETLARNRSIWIAGLVLAGVMVGFALLLLRRSRTAPAASLITQSFERKNKR